MLNNFFRRRRGGKARNQARENVFDMAIWAWTHRSSADYSVPHQGMLLALPANIRLGYKGF